MYNKKGENMEWGNVKEGGEGIVGRKHNEKLTKEHKER